MTSGTKRSDLKGSPSPQSIQVSIIIPCFNEQRGLKENATRVIEHMTALKNPFELLLINDGSTDNTGQIIRELENQNPSIKGEAFDRNRGRGAAIKRGLSVSRGDIVIILDADLSYDVHHIDRILKEFDSTSHTDVVVVSPYMKGGTVTGVPWQRLAVSKAANWILGGYFGGNLSTVTCVVRGYRGSLIRGLTLLEDGKELHLEILKKAHLQQAVFKEIPGDLVWSRAKSSPNRSNNRVLIGAAKKHFLYALLARPTRFIGLVASTLIIVGAYEGFNVMKMVLAGYQSTSDGFARDLWVALSYAFSTSPHTVLIAVACTIMSIQAFSFLALFAILKLQHEETLRHVLAINSHPPHVDEGHNLTVDP